jgi:teichuronic acid biosynthesis glycosyltransferase TuaC
MNARPLSVLTFTTLFPNPARPSHGIFVANRLDKLVASGQVRAHVVAPVPWRPGFLDDPQLGRLDQIPLRRRHHDMAVEHPRYAVIPKIGMRLAPTLLYRTARQCLETLLRMGHRFDLIDAHYFYPDGVAAVRLAQDFGLPVVVTARGTDLNLIPRYAGPRRKIAWAARNADGLVTVCEALKGELVNLGIAPERVTVLRNGVDLARFHPIDRDAARRQLGLRRRTLLSVGHLIERKGHHHVIEALPRLADTDLLIAGQGPQADALARLALQHNVSDRVRFLGNLDPERLRQAYNAADALVLASSREGWANVLLEAMACGTPVVASAVWGTPEVVASPAAGVLMRSLNAPGVVEAVERLFCDLPERHQTRRYAEAFDWEPTTAGQLALFRQAVAQYRDQPSRAA